MTTHHNPPISVKGIVFENNKVWLRKNERNEWELPGGKMEPDEQPEDTVIREIREELGFKITIKHLVQAHLYRIKFRQQNTNVIIITYLCNLVSKTGTFELVGEAGKSEYKLFSPSAIKKLRMPKFYKEAIATAKK